MEHMYMGLEHMYMHHISIPINFVSIVADSFKLHP